MLAVAQDEAAIVRRIFEAYAGGASARTIAKALQAEDVAEAVLFAAKLPPRAVVTELQLLPTVL